jgi:putative transposase
MRRVRGRNGGGDQRWATFLKNHAERMWVCDFIQTHDLLFRQVHAFFLVHLASRRVVYVAATRHPTQAWTAQQLRNIDLSKPIEVTSVLGGLHVDYRRAA